MARRQGPGRTLYVVSGMLLFPDTNERYMDTICVEASERGAMRAMASSILKAAEEWKVEGSEFKILYDAMHDGGEAFDAQLYGACNEIGAWIVDRLRVDKCLEKTLKEAIG